MCQASGKKIVGQYPLMLGIVLEFDDIEVAIFGTHQVALRTAAHTFYVLHRLHRQDAPRDKPPWLRQSSVQDSAGMACFSVMNDTATMFNLVYSQSGGTELSGPGTLPHRRGRSRSCAARRFLGAVEQFLQHRGVVLPGIAGSEQQR